MQLLKPEVNFTSVVGPALWRKARLIQIAQLSNMASNAVAKFSRIFGRKSSVVIGMIHVEALPGNV